MRGQVMMRMPGCTLLRCAVLGISCSGAASASFAAAMPDLLGTTLYTTTARGCATVDLATWQHPTRDVLRTAQATVAKAELCNAGRFPIFTVTLPYDPNGQTGPFFNRLFADLAEANGFWSYALVDLSDNVVITVTTQRAGRSLLTSYEEFRTP